MAVEDLRVMGRATQGVKLINIKDSDSIAAVAKVMHEEDTDEEEIVEAAPDDGDNTSETDNTTNDNQE
jgi:DNA gyrase subunit A